MEIKLLALSGYRDYPVHFARLKWLFETIEMKRKPGIVRILDVGCGTGNITIPLGLLNDSVVVGIDMFQPNIDYLNKHNTRQNVSAHFALMKDVDVRQFDFIIFTEVLEHIPNYREIFQDLSARMGNDTMVLITIPAGRGPFEIAMKPMYWLRSIGLNKAISRVKKIVGKREPYAFNQELDPHVNFFTRKQIDGDCEKFGFERSGIQKAFVAAPIFETYLPFVPLQRIAALDNRLAQKLPYWLASGWYYWIKKK